MSKIYNTNGSNNSASNIHHTTDTEAVKNIYVPDYIDTIFQRLDAQNVEQFYKSYHLWSLQQRMKTLQTEIGAIQQAIVDNNALMQQIQPSAIALASLAQLQASGVNDLELLDRMLARGDTWLDHTMQLLEQCEELDVIRGDYTQWCEHALEGAYEWIFSIENREATLNATQPVATVQQALQTPTEEQLLLKLMSDEEMTAKIPVPDHQFDEFKQATLQPALPRKRITQPLEQPELEVPEASPPTRKITQPLEQPELEAPEASPPTRKNTRPLELKDAFRETGEEASPDVHPAADEPSSPSDERTPGDAPTPVANVSPETSTSIVPEISDTIAIEEAQPVPEQIEEMKGIVIPATEQIGASSVQEETIDDTKAIIASKDVDVRTEVDVTEKRVISVAAPAQTRNASMTLLASSQENKVPQTQKVRQRGFWHWLRRLVAAILRR